MRKGLILFLFFLLAFNIFSQTKSVVMIIAPSNFRDEELLVTRKVLEDKGVEVKVASVDISSIQGMLGARVIPDLRIEDINLDNFDGVVFVGGVGAQFYWNYQPALRIAQKVFKKGKIVAAICIAPVILANAGILEDKKATVWSSEAERIEEKGAIYVKDLVVKDGNIITASGPQAAEKFGETIAQALFEK